MTSGSYNWEFFSKTNSHLKIKQMILLLDAAFTSCQD